MVTPVAIPAPPAASRLSLAQSLGFAVALVYLFLIYSRVLDMMPLPVHGPLVTGGLAAGAAILVGGLWRAFGNRIGLALAAFTFWMMVCIPFSVWRGGSVDVLKEWLRSILTYLVVAALVVTAQQCRRTFAVLGSAVFVLAILAMLFGVVKDGRLWLPQGKFANPNDLAHVLLTGLPFCWFFASDPRSSRLRRIGFALCIPMMLVVIARTGSRGVLIAIAAVVVVLFVYAPFIRKLQLMAACLVFVALAAIFLHHSLIQRFLTFETAPPAAEAVQEQEQEEEPGDRSQEFAVGSLASRKRMLWESVVMTFKNPIVGVGPGQFAVAQNSEAKEAGYLKGAWTKTHNSYTEVSSETGFPGLLCYLLAMVYCFKAVGSRRLPAGAVPSPEWNELSHMAFCLKLSLVGYAVGSVFSSVAYEMHFPVLAGLAVAVSSARSCLPQPSSGPALRRSSVPTPKWARKMSAQPPAEGV